MYLYREKKRDWGRGVRITLWFSACAIFGTVGHAYLYNKTNVKPIETYVLHEISGRNELEKSYANDALAYQKEIERLKSDMATMRQQQISRGEIERVEILKKEKVIQAISNNLKGVFEEKADAIYIAGKKNGVNPMLLAAIINHETANGSSDVCVKANNPGGINWFRGCGYPKYGWYIKYTSLNDGIYAMASLIRRNYIDKGLKDISSIGAKYAPVSDRRNGLYGMDNGKWPVFVELNYQKIYGESK